MMSFVAISTILTEKDSQSENELVASMWNHILTYPVTYPDIPLAIDMSQLK